MLHPFNVFQLFSVIFWMFTEYVSYASSILFITFLTVFVSLMQTMKSLKQLRKMSQITCSVYVYRDSQRLLIDASELCIGDVFDEFSTVSQIPCDALILEGDAIINECMLTGESLPVNKRMVTEEDFDFQPMDKSTIYAGTEIIRARRIGAKSPLLMVTATGFNTRKGNLIRSILFPKPNKFKFYQDSFKFIGVMFCIALFGFGISVFSFVRYGFPVGMILQKALDLITIVVPPALPATMVISINFSVARLRKKQIFCTSPSRVNISGQLNIVCFDKTGTLTEEGLDVWGVKMVKPDWSGFEELQETIDSQPLDEDSDVPPLLHALATCHSLKQIADNLIGDPLDLKMFQFTKWQLEDCADGFGAVIPIAVRPPGSVPFKAEQLLRDTSHAECIENDDSSLPSSNCPAEEEDESLLKIPYENFELGIVRTFEFSSHLRRMSVIVKRLGSPSLEIFVKGSPEGIKNLCLPKTMPPDFDSLLESYTRDGYRVLALASKRIESLTWIKSQKIKRDEIEKELNFLGFIVFENKLKITTTSVIKELTKANIRSLMCTGDNILTAISVAKECTIIPDEEHRPIFVPTLNEEETEISWVCMNESELNIKGLRLDPETLSPNMYISYGLACTGAAFEFYIDRNMKRQLDKLLITCQIFARMSPEQKQKLVELLQEMEYCVSFCGDGANDCGALKAADVGVSLSQAEASVAAPFTSQVQDISCMLQVIR